MPKGYKNPSTLAAEIKMTRANHCGTFLVVEGANDVRFWAPRRHVDCDLVDGEGKKNVVGVVNRLDAVEFDGVLGVVDSDYDSLNGVMLGSDNLVATDAHDLECLLCRSSALDTVLAEFGSSEKIQRFERREGVDVRTSLLNRAEIFGRLRWAVQCLELSIDSGLIRVPRFVHDRSWTVDRNALIRTVQGEISDGSTLSAQIDSLSRPDPWYVVQGPDLIELLRIGLKHVLGDLPNTTGYKEIARVLRAAISTEELKTTKFGVDIRRWEVRNSPYAVFPA